MRVPYLWQLRTCRKRGQTCRGCLGELHPGSIRCLA